MTLLLRFLSSSPGRSPKKTLRPHNWSFISIFSGSLRENLGLKRLETRFFPPTATLSAFAPPAPAPGARRRPGGAKSLRTLFAGPAPGTGPREGCRVNCSSGFRPASCGPAPGVTHAFSCRAAAWGPCGTRPVGGTCPGHPRGGAWLARVCSQSRPPSLSEPSGDFSHPTRRV